MRSHEGRSGRVGEAISEGEQEVALFEYSLRLDMALAMASDTTAPFFGKTLPSAVADMQEAKSLLESKAAYITGKYPDLNVNPTISILTEVIEAYDTIAKSANAANQPIAETSFLPESL